MLFAVQRLLVGGLSEAGKCRLRSFVYRTAFIKGRPATLPPRFHPIAIYERGGVSCGWHAGCDCRRYSAGSRREFVVMAGVQRSFALLKMTGLLRVTGHSSFYFYVFL